MAPSKKPSATPSPKQASSAKKAQGPAIRRPLRQKVISDMTQSPKQAAVAAKAPAAKKAIDEAAAAIAKQVSSPDAKPAQSVAPAQPKPSSSQEALMAAVNPAPTAKPEQAQSESRNTETRLEGKPAAAAANPKPVAEQAMAVISKEARMNVELPLGAAKMARKSVDQAQAAFDKANDLAHSNVQIFDAAAGAIKSNATELQLKAMEIAQANSNAVFGLLRRLLAARQVSELFEVQRSFAGEQFVSFVRHMSELNAICLKLANDTAKPLQQGVLRSFEELKKTAAS